MSSERESTLAKIECKLQAIDSKVYLDLDCSKRKLFKRALHVFRLSYFGYECLADNSVYKAKLSEYVDLMSSVFQPISQLDMVSLLYKIDQKIEESQLIVYIRIADCKFGQEPKNAKMVVTPGFGTNQPREVFLTEETDSWQCSDTITFRIGFHQLKEARALGQELKVEIHVCNSTGEKMILPQKLTLRYVNIHPEGYRAWFDFGLTVRCLVAIRFSVEGDHIDRRQAQLEHTQLIWHLFKHRHDAYIELDDGPSFDSTAHSCQRNEKQSNSYYSLVEPNSNDAFWPTAESVRMSTVSIDDIFGTVRSLQGSDFHCHDLELPNNENDDPTEEMFCRCSQWCSVSSFYWHNPIFRFLMVQFSNFYLSEQSNHPSSYMCALSALFAQTSQHRKPAPLLSLLSSVLSYMKQQHSKKIKFPTIDACSYKYIRSVEIAHLAEIRNSGEFNDKQVACIGSYCQLFTYLHAHVGKMEHIVKSDDSDVWYDQLYERIFQGYNLYLYESTHKGLYAFKNYSLIPLFDRFKYSPKWANFDLHMEHVIRLREQLYKAKFNSLNVHFNCHPFLHVIYNISKFIMEIYQSLTSGEKKTQRGKFAIDFDRLLCTEMPPINYESALSLASLTVQPRSSLDLERYRKELYMLLTLKQYSYACILQQYFTASLVSYNQAAIYDRMRYIPGNLQFVFDSQWIEHTLSQAFPMERLFVDECAKFEEVFFKFYHDIWPATELSFADDQEEMHGILQEYCKLCLWWKIDGRNSNVFKRILVTHSKLLANCLARADHLFTNEFAFIKRLPLTTGCVDYLMKSQVALNLVQAVCFTLSKVTYCLIKLVHALQPEEHTQRKVSLTLARPGIIELVSTLDATLKSLDKLKPLFLAFNDEFDTIGRTIRGTEHNIKNMYRELYVKLFLEWHCQVENLIARAAHSYCPSKMVAILHFALVVETHFVTRFHRYFRADFCEFKNLIDDLKKKLRPLSGFNYQRYRQQLDDIFEFEINSTSSMPYMVSSPEPLEFGVFQALSVINIGSMAPSELLQELGVKVDCLG